MKHPAIKTVSTIAAVGFLFVGYLQWCQHREHVAQASYVRLTAAINRLADIKREMNPDQLRDAKDNARVAFVQAENLRRGWETHPFDPRYQHSKITQQQILDASTAKLEAVGKTPVVPGGPYVRTER